MVFKIKLSSKAVFTIDRFFWTANQRIRMIYESSCDTEDWSNDAENSNMPLLE